MILYVFLQNYNSSSTPNKANMYGKMKPPRSTTTGSKTPQVHLKVVGVLPGGRGSTIGPKTASENGDFNHDSSHYTARMWRLCLHVTQQIACMLCQVDEEWAFGSFTTLLDDRLLITTVRPTSKTH